MSALPGWLLELLQPGKPMPSHVTNSWQVWPHFPWLFHSHPLLRIIERPWSLQRAFWPGSLLSLGLSIFTGFLVGIGHPSSRHHTHCPPAKELHLESTSSQVSITESFWVQEQTGRVPRYKKGTHLQHLTEFISPSEKGNVITSPSCNANRSFAFICNLRY